MFINEDLPPSQNIILSEIIAFFEGEECCFDGQETSFDFERVDDFFYETHLLFKSGHFLQAYLAYRVLFNYLIDPELWGGLSFILSCENYKADLILAKKEYLLSIYLSTCKEDRSEELVQNLSLLLLYNKLGFTFLDLQEFYGKQLPDFHQFLTEVLEKLKEDFFPETAPELLLEAASILQGKEGIIALAREMGEEFPEAYLEWIEILKKEGDYLEIIKVAKEGLENFAHCSNQIKIAKELAFAAEQIGDYQQMIDALTTIFSSSPHLEKMILLLEKGSTYLLPKEIYQKTKDLLEIIRKEKMGNLEACRNYPHLLLHLHLWGGEFQKAIDSASETSHLYLTTLLLRLLLPNEETPQSLNKVIEIVSNYYEINTEVFPEKPFYQKFFTRVQSHFLKISQEERYYFFIFCQKVIQMEINEILSLKIRHLYELGADLLAALYDTVKDSIYREEAYDFCKKIQSSFPRHRAFQEELKRTGLFK